MNYKFITLILIMTFNLFFPINIYNKVIIWDLGKTLFRTSKFQALRQIGIKDYIFYPFNTGKKPYQIPQIAFQVLDQIKIKNINNYNLAPATDNGQILPICFRSWLAGLTSGDNIINNANIIIENLDKKNYFYNAREKRLVKNTIEFIFNPKKLALAQRPIRKAVKILRQCHNKNHKLIILSNWEQSSFNTLYMTRQGQKVFKYFKPENIVISGNIKLIKPDPRAFKYVIDNYNIEAKDCIFIDDEEININAAKVCGMNGLLIENGNFKKLQKQLKDLKII